MLRATRTALQIWNKNTFGVIQDYIKAISKDNENLQSLPPSKHNLSQEASLQILRVKLLDSKETLWKQKSRDKYIQEGDRNTKFFHTITLCHRQRNYIKWLKKENGECMNDRAAIAMTLVSFFEDHPSNNSKTIPLPQGLIKPIIKDQGNILLIKIPTLEEIKDLVFSIGALKALELDGFLSIFYKYSWEKIQHNVVEMVTTFFKNPHDLSHLNQTNITLIPKTNNPISPNHF